MVSRPVLLKIKGKRLDFHEIVGFWGVKKTEQMKTNGEIGQLLVSGALDHTKKMRKTAADIFAKSGPENPQEKPKQIKMFSGFFQFFP